ncbi:autoinducer 2 import ATP-binding protein LsrA [Anaerotignum neopropionicum]|uniref:Autoinducer 2 import ATP-binding protein LsrA n=1 Tax=Anaerotignum neopropionicum TaxID=36847 RepID=A0A136WIT4_9FIRM|nr:sugar ABC transporter ATP-binding protein [Anaerotignum neopropionicum]KXL54249.1 autoinducer 2 import ATP-binding protein LsrA [Anaerotignum neopropionicum]KXL54374.1 autoinducer 2 import ATP-binding protein LsrA [Anaerotignum neopropionicum]
MGSNKKDEVKIPAISIKRISKSFASNVVLREINLHVFEGDVVALIGGNGAGKSTLMKILMGIYQPDAGEIFMSGKRVSLSSPSAALAQGIYLVPQEPMLFPNMTVEENIVLGFKEKRSQLHERLKALIENLGWDLKLDRKAESLSIAEQQLVEILRGLLRNSRILILDEPTSALTFHEIESLFRIVTDLHKNGISIFYITHRLTEVFDIATRVVILRDGQITMEGAVEEFNQEMLIQGLLPANYESAVKKERECTDVECSGVKPLLDIKNFSGYGFSDINLEVYPGEILGMAGVVGSGRTEFAVTVFGKDIVKSGKVFLGGEDITGKKCSCIIEKGLNYVPEDRHLNGIYSISDVEANITSGVLGNLNKFFVDRKKVNELTDQYINNFRIKVTGRDQAIGSLSGGNQQKVVLGKTLAANPKVVILDEPTRGIDAGARGDVYRIINELRAQGVAILLISSDIEEVVELSDRVVTMYQGRINHTFKGESITVDNLMAASFGVYKKEVTA